MPLKGLIWGTIICVPLWLIVILSIKVGIIAVDTIIFIGLILSGLLLFLILTSSQNTKRDEKDNHFFSPAKKVRPSYNLKMELKIADNGGTRLGIDRRKFHYTAYSPEQRSGIDRRKGYDRRCPVTSGIGVDRKNGLYHPAPYRKERRDIFRLSA